MIKEVPNVSAPQFRQSLGDLKKLHPLVFKFRTYTGTSKTHHIRGCGRAIRENLILPEKDKKKNTKTEIKKHDLQPIKEDRERR